MNQYENENNCIVKYHLENLHELVNIMEIALKFITG